MSILLLTIHVDDILDIKCVLLFFIGALSFHFSRCQNETEEYSEDPDYIGFDSILSGIQEGVIPTEAHANGEGIKLPRQQKL